MRENGKIILFLSQMYLLFVWWHNVCSASIKMFLSFIMFRHNKKFYIILFLYFSLEELLEWLYWFWCGFILSYSFNAVITMSPKFLFISFVGASFVQLFQTSALSFSQESWRFLLWFHIHTLFKFPIILWNLHKFCKIEKFCFKQIKFVVFDF